ncbi:hypothetical protein [Cohnella sp. GCM10012308]|uniref:hypothetical protein n=1 Tax=Cohnella sp. GCM10012308 TaxID=3317329 RepID=UPI0036227887
MRTETMISEMTVSIVRRNASIRSHQAAEALMRALAFEHGATPNAGRRSKITTRRRPSSRGSMKKLVGRPFCSSVLGETAACSPVQAVRGL